MKGKDAVVALLRESACPVLGSCFKCGRRGKNTAHSRVFVMSVCKYVVLPFNAKVFGVYRLDEQFMNRRCIGATSSDLPVTQN